MNTRELILKKQSLSLNRIQKEIIIGTLLGDGCLIVSGSGRSARLQILQNHTKRLYVDWIYDFFRDWVIYSPKLDPCNNSYFFRTVSHEELMDYRRMFYVNGKRKISREIIEHLTSPLSLAIWFMDDGNGYRNHDSLRISSYGFGRDGNKLLKNALRSNFGLEVVIGQDTKGVYLNIPSRTASRFYSMIKPFVVPCMMYKLRSLTP